MSKYGNLNLNNDWPNQKYAKEFPCKQFSLKCKSIYEKEKGKVSSFVYFNQKWSENMYSVFLFIQLLSYCYSNLMKCLR